LCIVGKAAEEIIIYIDAVQRKITIERAPLESVDTHLLAEELTEMYADDEQDKRNIAVVSSGRGAEHARMGVLNFSFWDWRRGAARTKQAGRGGIGTVFRDKKIKALVLKNNLLLRPWSITENKMARDASFYLSSDGTDRAQVDRIAEKYQRKRAFALEMLNDIIEQQGGITKEAIQQLSLRINATKGALYHLASMMKGMNENQFKHAEEVKADIKGYMKKGGYEHFKKALTEDDSSVMQQISKAPLYGAGKLSAGEKLQRCRSYRREKGAAYVICNANSPVNGGLAAENPHAVIEGMLIGGRAVGAAEGLIYISKPGKAVVAQAAAQAKEEGWLGENIQGKDFGFDITVRLSRGGLQADETSAMLSSLAGKAPDSKSLYVDYYEKGFGDRPTIVLTAELWAQIPGAFGEGADYRPTRRLAVRGAGVKAQVMEVPVDTTLEGVVKKLGVTNFKAVQMGGPAGGFLPADKLDVKLDYGSLKQADAALGAGEVCLLEESDDIVDKVRERIEYLAGESCGKCTACREGLFAMKNILDRICNGNGQVGDIGLLREVAEMVGATSLCCFGKNAAIPVISSLRYFKEQYEQRIKKA
ncbi:MAG: hypothetical protein AMJ79_11875, partial [Phycisphaerae bacterium SM23_30]